MPFVQWPGIDGEGLTQYAMELRYTQFSNGTEIDCRGAFRSAGFGGLAVCAVVGHAGVPGAYTVFYFF